MQTKLTYKYYIFTYKHLFLTLIFGNSSYISCAEQKNKKSRKIFQLSSRSLNDGYLVFIPNLPALWTTNTHQPTQDILT